MDFWLLSARVPRDSNFFQTTRGIGAKVTVTLTDGTNRPSFPVSQAITLTDQSKKGPTVRAYLGIHILSRYDLWNTSDANHPIKTTGISVPVSYVRIVGSSAAVQVMNALISFSGSTNSGLPADPYAPEAQMVGQLVNSLGNIFNNSKDVDDPNFALSFGTSQQSSGCNPEALKEGAGVEITDYDKGTPQQGVIRIEDVDNYCFYQDGDTDPDIVFVSKNGICASSMPASGYTHLMNPLFIWAAYGVCKTDNGCEQSSVSTQQLSKLAPKMQINSMWKNMVQQRLGSSSSDRLSRALQIPTEEAARSLTSKEADTIHALSICMSVGISTEKCLGVKP
ncbi:MAG: hypothetical protein ACRD5K_14810 [Candidatus Acidiferrales bacterium]